MASKWEVRLELGVRGRQPFVHPEQALRGSFRLAGRPVGAQQKIGTGSDPVHQRPNRAHPIRKSTSHLTHVMQRAGREKKRQNAMGRILKKNQTVKEQKDKLSV